MSVVKKCKFGILFLLTFVTFFMFGCKNDVAVDDIYFNLKDSEQIVMYVGQTLNIEEYVVVTPSYATNKGYSIVSLDEDVIKVENNKLVALKESNQTITI